MFMKLLLLLLVLNSAWASQEICYPAITSTEFAEMVTRAKLTHMPCLIETNIAIREFESDAYYLQAKPEIKSLLKKKQERKYFVEVNPKLYLCPPSMDALEAILVHEFEHVVDYEKMSALGIARFGAKYGTSKKYRAKYERATDEKVLKKNLGLGLIGYREWIYSKLSPKDILIKKRYYYTPEEIDEWIATQHTN